MNPLVERRQESGRAGAEAGLGREARRRAQAPRPPAGSPAACGAGPRRVWGIDWGACWARPRAAQAHPERRGAIGAPPAPLFLCPPRHHTHHHKMQAVAMSSAVSVRPTFAGECRPAAIGLPLASWPPQAPHQAPLTPHIALPCPRAVAAKPQQRAAARVARPVVCRCAAGAPARREVRQGNWAGAAASAEAPAARQPSGWGWVLSRSASSPGLGTGPTPSPERHRQAWSRASARWARPHSLLTRPARAGATATGGRRPCGGAACSAINAARSMQQRSVSFPQQQGRG